MKKLLVMIMVLGLATVANAGLKISVGGVVDVENVVLQPSDTVIIDVWSDGTTTSGQAFFLTVEGPGFIDVSQGINNVFANVPIGTSIMDIGPDQDPPMPAGTFIFLDMSIVAEPIPPVPGGTVIDSLIFHCSDFGDVTLILSGSTDGELDRQTIIQPEPITIALLGLGGLFLRRRK